MTATAIVTGSSQGVGLGIAKVFLDQGWNVCGSDLQEAPQDIADHPGYHHITGDLREAEACRRVVDGAVERFGRLDALVNNAGLGGAKPFADTPEEDFERYYGINVRPVLRLIRHALPHLGESGGSVVNIASAFGLVGVAISAAYVPTKTAVIGITQMLATEYGRDGIRVNAVAPGLIYTPGTQERVDTNEWWHRHMIESSPLGRVGQPEEIGHAAEFLASPRASFVTGVVLPVDGGWSMAKFPPEPREGE